MLSRFHLKPIAAALLVTVASGAAYAEATVKEEVSVLPGRQITQQDEANISSAAVKVLRHIADARGELQGDKPDTDKAKTNLAQSEKLLDIIQAGLPTSEVKDRIWVAKKHLEYQDTREVLPDLVPIYASLEELVNYMPTAGAKAHLDQAKKALEKGDNPKAREQLAAVDDALLYVEADLPMASTRHLVAEAKANLDKGDAKAADQALNAAEDNVVFMSVSFQSPLTHAKAALWRASQDYNLGNKDLAKADLNEAVKYLERVARDTDKVTREAAAKLVSEVRALHQSIASGDQNYAARIDSAWHRVEALSERSAEYISTGWQRLRAEGAGKKELIEAKLQVAYARIDHLYSKDDAAAKIDLAEAKGYLDAAAKQVKAEEKTRVETLSTQVAGLERALQTGDQPQGDATAFHTAEAGLVQLIRQL